MDIRNARAPERLDKIHNYHSKIQQNVPSALAPKSAALRWSYSHFTLIQWFHKPDRRWLLASEQHQLIAYKKDRSRTAYGLDHRLQFDHDRYHIVRHIVISDVRIVRWLDGSF